MKALALMLVFALMVAACGEEVEAPTTTTSPSPTTPPDAEPPAAPGEALLVRADVPRATTTDVAQAELAELVAGNTEFALDLFRAVADGNTILSPYSAAAALTMAYAGARDDTGAEMRETLRMRLDDNRIHAARNQLDLAVGAEPGPVGEGEPEPFVIRVANSLWGQQGYPFLDEFLVLLAENYDAGMSLVDFVTATEQARTTINDWVEKATEGRIADLIPEGVLDDMTRLVLTNAIWFKAAWADQFDPELTTDHPFTLPDGRQITVPMMRSSQQLSYGSGPGYQAVRIPYAGDASMLVIVPDSLDEMVTRLDTQMLSRIRDGLSLHQVDLGLPRFEFRSELTLSRVLEELGMVAAFTDPALPEGADFTGITENRELYIQAVIQQAFITVDEEGTEAAAATAIAFGITSAPPPATMVVDRPFLFLIEHGSTGEILFIGQVIDPA